MDIRESFIKKTLTEEEINTLVTKAREASLNSYRKLSTQKIGTCILTKDGNYYTGCQIEVGGFQNGIHAEQCAMANAIAHGSKEPKALALYAEGEDDNSDEFCQVCGSCKQFLCEFSLFLPVILVRKNGAMVYEILHGELPMHYMSEIKQSKNQNPYEIAAEKAYKWILKDYYFRTREEMKNLLNELNFDEIHNRFVCKLGFKTHGTIRSIFQCGPAYLNYVSWQLACQGFAKFIKAEFSGIVEPKVMVAHDNAAYCGNLCDLACAVFTEFDVPIFKGGPIFGSKLITKGKIEGFFDRDFMIYLSDSGGSGEISIQFFLGDMNLIDEETQKAILKFIHEENTLVDLSKFFDYKHVKLKNKEEKKNKEEDEEDTEQMIKVSMEHQKFYDQQIHSGGILDFTI